MAYVHRDPNRVSHARLEQLKAAERNAARASRPRKPCGTTAAYHAHVRRHERPCDPCRLAINAYNTKLRQGRPTGRKNRAWTTSEKRLAALRRDLPNLAQLEAEAALIRARTAEQTARHARESAANLLGAHA